MWGPTQRASCLIILSRFDVIGLRYVLDQIMKRLPCFFHRGDTMPCLFDANLNVGVTNLG